MRTHHVTPADEEFILSIATHPRLHPKCWEMIANTQPLGDALADALQGTFPSEMKVCRLTAWMKKQSFWGVVADLVDRGFFQTANEQHLHAIACEARKPLECDVERNVLGGSPDDAGLGIHMPGEMYDYRLMSGTS